MKQLAAIYLFISGVVWGVSMCALDEASLDHVPLDIPDLILENTVHS